ncbi:Hypothetical protein D9617_1g081080 [Elsinoe fawcettii]|nr:Hypothetical protein D9617_1g081080 [Elsinoe fawcettii]
MAQQQDDFPIHSASLYIVLLIMAVIVAVNESRPSFAFSRAAFGVVLFMAIWGHYNIADMANTCSAWSDSGAWGTRGFQPAGQHVRFTQGQMQGTCAGSATQLVCGLIIFAYVFGQVDTIPGPSPPREDFPGARRRAEFRDTDKEKFEASTSARSGNESSGTNNKAQN